MENGCRQNKDRLKEETIDQRTWLETDENKTKTSRNQKSGIKDEKDHPEKPEQEWKKKKKQPKNIGRTKGRIKMQRVDLCLDSACFLPEPLLSRNDLRLHKVKVSIATSFVS
jgi:hypothetical protein